ncbi:MAG: OmpA family protein [Bacteroidota bacterium]
MKRLLIIIFVLTSVFVNAQSMLQKADTAFFKMKDYNSAIDLYQKTIAKERNTEVLKSIYFKIGEAYRLVNKYKEAINWYDKAIASGYSEAAINNGYGDVLVMAGDYTKAKGFYKTYLTSFPNDKLVKVKLESCDFVNAQKTNKPLYQIENQASLNSEYSDYGINYFKNELVLSSARMSVGSKYDPSSIQGFSDIYTSSFDTAAKKWTSPRAVDGYINTKYNEGTFSYSTKDNIAYYMQCNGESGKTKNCDVFLSKYDELKKMWLTPEVISISSDSFSTGHPAISEDGNTLYFVSDMSGGYGGKDIYRVKKISENVWTKPENLGETINTPGNEMFPFISGDSMLVFASNGLVGMGSLDIYYSKIKNGKFEKPVNFLPPFNSTADDFGLIFNKKGLSEGFFCSNRQEGSVGDDDIYKFTLVPVELMASGVVVNQKGLKPIKGATIILKSESGLEMTTSTDKDGKYSIAGLMSNEKFNVRVEKEGFFADSKNLKIGNEKFSKSFSKATGFDLDFALLEMTKEEIELPNIYYDFNKAELREESKLELEKLIKLLNESPELAIVINAHTDEKGKPAYNLDLSAKRAQSVVDFLVSKGISAQRLSSKGWGATRPVKKNATTEAEDQMNRRTTFQVTNIDQFKTADQLKGVDFRLQFSASKVLLEEPSLAKVKSILPDSPIKFSKDLDGFYRYTIGLYATFDEALNAQDKLMSKGVESFVVAFSDGEKISIKDAKKMTEKK